MKLKRFISSILCLVLTFSLFSAGASPVLADSSRTGEPSFAADAAQEPETGEGEDELSPEKVTVEPVNLTEDELAIALENAEPMLIEKVEEPEKDDLPVDLFTNKGREDKLADIIDNITPEEGELVRVIVIMEEASIIDANPNAVPNGIALIEAQELEEEQNAVISTIENDILGGEPLEVSYQYSWLLNGFAARLPYGKIDQVEALEGVKKVVLQPVYHPLEDRVSEPMTDTEDGMIGRGEAWDAGYKGKGMKIAVLDTGLDEDHPSFAALSDDRLVEGVSATEQSVGAVLGNLQASEKMSGLTAESVYRSTKVPFGFNYADGSTRIDHTDGQGDHGTHVAGIAAANKIDGTDVVGVAPDAQLFIMKVFGTTGGAYAEDLLAALEDAMMLGADVINMSLGSVAGFTSDTEEINSIYAKVNQTGIVLSIAAGNAGAMGESNEWGSGSNLASNPDNSTISSPSTYEGAMSVASSEKMQLMSYYLQFNNSRYVYTDGSEGGNALLSTLSGQNLYVAVVDNAGQTAADFQKANVSGKVALVQRGVTSFLNKCVLAQEAGAVACLVYNNTAGTFGMSMAPEEDYTGTIPTIPCASITKKAGEALLAAVGADANTVLHVSSEQGLVDNEEAGQMSSFSSWGTTPDLHLEPDITTPGSNIDSTLDNGTYGAMSGTSMATPNLSGISALVLEYVKDKYPNIAGEDNNTRKRFVNALLMSTAELLTYNGNGLYFSPRSQGAGLANAYNAISSTAVLSVDGMGVPKVELFDDPQKTGSYHFRFNVRNFGESDLVYGVFTNVQTEDVVESEDYPGEKFMSLTPVALDSAVEMSSESMFLRYDYNDNKKINSHDAYIQYRTATGGNTVQEGEVFRYDALYDGAIQTDDVQAYLDELVQKDRRDTKGSDIDLWEKVMLVKAGATAAVDVSIQVTDAGKAWMEENFKNGIYVEGFTRLVPRDGKGVELSLPYMGFYGDWTSAPIIDGGFYWDDYANGETDVPTFSQYYNMLWTNPSYSIPGYSTHWVPGENPYDVGELTIDEKHVSLSPDGDGYTDYIDDIYVSLLRNARELSITYTNETTGEKLYERTFEHVPKSYYNDQYQMIIPFIFSMEGEEPCYLTKDGKPYGEPLDNNTEISLDVSAVLDYKTGDMSANQRSHWKTTITIDTEGPELLDAKIESLESGGQRVLLTFKDQVGVAAVNFLSKSGRMIYAQEPVDDEQYGVRGEDGSITYTNVPFDITGFGNDFMLVLGDYAFNTTSSRLRTEGNMPVLDPSLLYGYRVGDAVFGDPDIYGWLGVDTATGAAKVYSSEYYLNDAVTAAEYVDGFIIAQDESMALSWIRPGDWEERTTITQLDELLREMALDPKDQKIYAVTLDGNFGTIDPATGKMTKIGESKALDNLMGLACDNDGTLYGMDSDGKLKTVNKETGAWGETVLLDTSSTTGAKPMGSQSLAYNSADGKLYWAFYTLNDTEYIPHRGVLYRIDPKGKTITQCGNIAAFEDGRAQLVGLLKLDSRGYALPKDTLKNITLSPEKLSLVEGEHATFEVRSEPWYLSPEKLTWTSEDDSVASVDEYGEITAVSEGQTMITATTEDGGISATGTVTVTKPKATLHGFIDASAQGTNQWIKFPAADVEQWSVESEDGPVVFAAAEYLDGYVYAFDSDMGFWRLDPKSDFNSVKLSDSRGGPWVYDMAFDYSSGYMYALTESGLYYVDVLSGELSPAENLTLTPEQEPDSEEPESDPTGGFTSLAITTEGDFYFTNSDRNLYKRDHSTGTVERVGLSGCTALEGALTYDHDHKQLYLSNDDGGIYYVDMETGRAAALGYAQTVVRCLLTIPETEPVRTNVPVQSVTLENDSVTVLVGGTKRAPVKVEPLNATHRNVEWTVSDETIATIDAGVITGVAEGTTTATGTLGGHTVTLNIEVVKASDYIYGFVLNGKEEPYADKWRKFSVTNPGEEDPSAEQVEYELTAGEYYGGNIYGYFYDEWDLSTFYVINASDYKTVYRHESVDVPQILDMAFDYTQGVMYAVSGALDYGDDEPLLLMVDLNTGECYEVGDLGATILALACDGSGNLVGVDASGTLYTIDKTTGTATALASGEADEGAEATDYNASGHQSMTYDFESGDFYWMECESDWYDVNGSLIRIDSETWTEEKVGDTNSETVAAYTLTNKPATQMPEVTGLQLASDSELMMVGETVNLKAHLNPVSVMLPSTLITFTSSDPAVATVDTSGSVTAVSSGTTTITATYAGNPENSENEAISAICTVTVVSDSDKIYTVTDSGLKSFPILYTDPETEGDEISFSGFDGGEIVGAAYNGSDNYIYLVDESDGYLWRVASGGETEKVGDEPVTEWMAGGSDEGDSSEESYLDVIDIAYHSSDSKLYLLAQPGYGSYALYSLDLEKHTATKAGDVTFSDGDGYYDLSQLAFMDNGSYAVFDNAYGANAIYTGTLGNGACTLLTELEGYTTYAGLAYSGKYGKLFLYDDNYDGGGLIVVDAKNGNQKVFEGVSYNFEYDWWVDLLFVTGELQTELPETKEEVSPVAAVSAYTFTEDGWNVRSLYGAAEIASDQTATGVHVDRSLAAVTYEPNQGLFYAVDRDTGVLLAIRPDTGESVVVNYHPVVSLIDNYDADAQWSDFLDIEYNAFDGKTYALISVGGSDGLGHTYLYTVDLTAAAATLVCEVGAQATAMTFVSAAEAVMCEAGGGIYRVDTASGAATWLAAAGGSPTALAYDSADGLVYMVCESGALCTLDLATGMVATVTESGYAGLTDLVLVDGGAWSGALPPEGEPLESSPEPEATPDPEATEDPEITPEPGTTATPEPTTGAEDTPGPGETAEPTPTEPTPAPEQPTEPAPELTPEPTPERTPEPTPEPTEEPSPGPAETETPAPGGDGGEGASWGSA